ncbi:MAG: S-layer homology domain-containing protein, partial [Actinobacteria bacterium]|nr:S-layer homology domain-containing protein [Actinomycetota bacterium]MCG2801783.1 S-layer homology domain-containing protein [Cellulomonas sp.]
GGSYVLWFKPSNSWQAAEFYPNSGERGGASAVSVAPAGTTQGVDDVLDPASTIQLAVDGWYWDGTGTPDFALAPATGPAPPSSWAYVLANGGALGSPITLPQVHAGAYRIVMWNAEHGWLPQFYRDSAATTVSADDATVVTVRADSWQSLQLVAPQVGGQIQGTVRTAAGAAVGGWYVKAQSSDGFQYYDTTTEQNGNYAITGLPAGRYSVYFDAPDSTSGWDAYYGTGTAPDEPNVEVAGTGTTTGIDITVGTTFRDVQPQAAFEADIAWLGAQGLTRPGADGRFGPGAPIQRAAMAAFLYRAAGAAATYTAPASSPFGDVTPSDPFYTEMAWLASSGVTQPGSDGKFGPSSPVTRAAMAAFLYRDAGSPTYDAPATSPFADVAVGDAFYKEMCWLYAQGITKPGSDLRFGPDDPVRREAMAAFLHRAATAGLIGA